MKKFLSISLLLLCLAAGMSCQRRPLYLLDEVGCKVVVKVLWKVDVLPDGIKPTGVTLYIFKDGEFYMSHTTADVDSCAVHLDPGKYKLLLISQSPDEFGQMEFLDMDNLDNAQVRALETKSTWYQTKGEEEVLMANPEVMVAGVSEEFEVSEEAVENFQEVYRDYRTRNQRGESGPEMERADSLVKYFTIRVPVNPRNVVSQLWISIYSDRADALKSVRASTSGMARSFLLSQDRTGPEEGTQIVSQWRLVMDDEFTRIGHLDGMVATFGYPNGEMPSPLRDSTLNVATLLVDNKTIQTYVFNVGDKIVAGEPPLGYRSLYRLVLGSVEEPVLHPADVILEDRSGFDANVEDWGEGETVEIPM